MTHQEEIMRAVGALFKQGKKFFSRKMIRDQIGADHATWMGGYTAIFQGMRVDHPGGAPVVGVRFRGVFQRVEHGIYVLTPKGERLLIELGV